KELRSTLVRAGAPAFAPDGQTIATVTRDGAVVLWETATLKERATFRSPATRRICSLRFSPDGTLLAAADEKCTVLWELATGKKRCTLPARPSGCLAFSPDGKTLASTGENNMQAVRIWDLATGKSVHERPGHEQSVESVAVSPDGKVLASIGDGT